MTLPKCVASNPEVQFIKSVADWSHINDPNKRIFCVAPGDYRKLHNIKLTRSGTSSKRRYIVLDNGNNTHPSKLKDSEQANYALFFEQASYWTVDRMSGLSPQVSRVVDFHGVKNGKPGTGATHNILNRLYIRDMGCAVRFGTDGDSNTLQNSRIEDMKLNSRKKDVMGVIIEDNIYGTANVTITNTKIVNNEIRNANDGIHVGRHSYTADGGQRQSGNIDGTIIAGNHIYITSDIYTDGKGNPTPTGLYSYSENAIDVKIGSNDASKPVLVAYNYFWGYRKSDLTDSALGDSGAASVFHFGVPNLVVRDNVIFDSAVGIVIADRRDEPYAVSDAVISHNLFYKCGGFGHAKTSTIALGQSGAVDCSDNDILFGRANAFRAAMLTDTVCIRHNRIIAHETGTNDIGGGVSSKALDCLEHQNTYYKTAKEAGFTKDLTFTTDRFSLAPRTITLHNASEH